MFFSLYFAASDCYFFLILAVLGILYYAWIVYRISYFLIGGATIIFECLAHSELSWKIFNAVCSMRVFWWIVSICGNIHIVAWVEREVEIRQAIASKHQSKEN